MNFEVKTSHKQAFKEIFNLVAKDGKIDKNGLKELFRTIDYKTDEQ
jgi:Ca2+-binding EF-hand superfamily protein